MLRSILVPLDGTPFGEHALPMALGLARRSGAVVHLVHVHRVLEAAHVELQLFDDRLDADLRRTEMKYLEQTRRRLNEVAPVDVATHLVEGDTIAMLCDEAQRVAADLVVLTTHARGLLGRLWFGDTADDLERALPMPLLLVHPTPTAPDPSADVLPRHLLVPLDGTPRAERVLDTAVAYARLVEADLTLLRALRPIYPYTVPGEVEMIGGIEPDVVARLETLRFHLEEEATRYLAGVADRLRAEGLTVHTTIVRDDPDAAILREAHRPIDLIVLMTHGRHGLSRLIHGSIADRVVRGSSLPILVQRAPE